MADGEQLKMRFFTKDQNNAVSTTAAGATDMRQAVAGPKHVAWGQVGSTSAPRDIARDSVEEKEGDKHVAWGRVGSTSAPRDIARDSIEEKEVDKHVAWGRVGSTSAPRDIARDSVEEKEGNKQGAEADVAMGSTNHHGDNNRSLRGTH
ncbi:Hypothetical protein NocV09_01300290 [Nannochloropsis oceanica]